MINLPRRYTLSRIASGEVIRILEKTGEIIEARSGCRASTIDTFVPGLKDWAEVPAAMAAVPECQSYHSPDLFTQWMQGCQLAG
jgi:hypothetical protein